jgi:RimJ/RimL family protein N-acetyltransferase
MILRRYGVTLVRLREEHLELVRQWRNDKIVRERMIYREFITATMQKEWFESINNYDNFYYIIEFEGEQIGLINNKNTDWEKGTTESGLFLVNDKYYDTHIPVASSFLLLEAGFYVLGGKDAVIHILDNNIKAIEYNRALGFEPVDHHAEKGFTEYVLSRSSFEKKTARVRQALTKLYAKNDPYYYLLLDPYDYTIGIAQEIEKVIRQLPKEMIHFIDFESDIKTLCLNF